MKFTFTILLTIFFGLMMMAASGVQAEWFADLESGGVFPGYNDVRVPNSTGTAFSLTDDVVTDGKVYFRARAGLNWGRRHSLFLLAAPLTLTAAGTIDRPVLFDGVEFPAETRLKARYTFNSYRLTYRYRVYDRPRMTAALGITAKIRDAEIRLDNGSQHSATTNVGFVPLVSFKLSAQLTADLQLILEGDALAGPQGRAEDVALMVEHAVAKSLAVKAGYRVLEGGADVETVYNFTMLHYFFMGISWKH